jgi:putative GTP pyrophosphokinase
MHPDAEQINKMVKHYLDHRDDFSLVLDQLHGHILHDKEIGRLAHSFKWRVKDPAHLREKLERKADECRKHGEAFNINCDNLFSEINDLAGYRILHLHTRQIKEIDRALQTRFEEARYKVTEGPIARVWDTESRAYFESIGMATKESKTTMYSSVHYVVEPNQKTTFTCEIQVRTLADEVWGEADHAINYPHPTPNVHCREQLAVLARLASTCSRLVDSVFQSHEEYQTANARKRRRRETAQAKAAPAP